MKLIKNSFALILKDQKCMITPQHPNQPAQVRLLKGAGHQTQSLAIRVQGF